MSPDLRTVLMKSTRNQQAAVAVERVLLRTHQSDAIFPGTLDHSLEASLELGGSGHALVVGDAVAIVLAALRTAAQLLSQEGIGDAVRAQLGLERRLC